MLCFGVLGYFVTGLNIFLYLKYTYLKVIPSADYPSVPGNAVFCSFPITFFVKNNTLGVKEGLNHKRTCLLALMATDL